MIKFENTEVIGWEHVIRGMRNPKNSWERSDSFYGCHGEVEDYECDNGRCDPEARCTDREYILGPNDHDLMMRLVKGGPVHAKYRRMIAVYVDITAPLYWWKEFDTYKVGTVANSCSTMHKIAVKEFTLEDFSHEHLSNFSSHPENVLDPLSILKSTIVTLNSCRHEYIETKDKFFWWQMIQLLPSSYNQKRTVMLNYEVLAGIYASRRNHKLDEWSKGFIQWIESLPYSEIITGFADKDHEKLVKDIGKILVTEYPTVEDFIDKWNSVCVGYPISKEAVEKLVDPTKRASEASRAIRDLMDKLNEKE